MRYLSLAPAWRAHALRTVACGVLALGYIDLIRGGITSGPVLLVIGYAVFVPAVILSWR